MHARRVRRRFFYAWVALVYLWLFRRPLLVAALVTLAILFARAGVTLASVGFAIVALLLVRRIVRRLLRVIVYPTMQTNEEEERARKERAELARIDALLAKPAATATAKIAWTQIAGRKCQVCRRTIVTMKDGVACADCGDAIHLERCATEHQAHRHAMHTGAYR
jgi:hypothetical protein